MKLKLAFLFISVMPISVFAQNESPYKTSLKVDGPIIGAGVGLSYLGLSLIKNKKELTDAEVAGMSKQDVNFFDRAGAGNYDNQADKISYYPFYGSFALPVVALLDKNIRNKTGQVLALYVETMAITGTLFTISAGSVKRSRPLVYNTSVPLAERKDKDSQRSFFAGHTAATAAATFFAAKVYNDFNPDSRAKPYIWAAAAVIPASVGYYRYKAGKHFLSDNLIGYIVGAGTGILVPHLHKKTNKTNLSIVPLKTNEFDGVSLSYTFK